MNSNAKRGNNLITCDVNMVELQQMMNNIIQVVNQHAKLLDTIGSELAVRPLKKDVGEMFSLLSHTFPFQKIKTKLGYEEHEHPPRLDHIIEKLQAQDVATDNILTVRQQQPVHCMWEGLDRYLITQEVAGEAILDFKHFKTEVSEFIDETRKALYTKADKEIFDQKLH